MKQTLTSKTLFTILLSTLFFLSLNARADTDPIKGHAKGKVITQDNKPAENVAVNLQGTDYGTVTDENGAYELRAPAGSYTLLLTHTGLKTQQINITIQAGQTTHVPTLSVTINVNTLEGVSISGSKTNKFVRKKSTDVAKLPLDNLENPQVYTTVSKELMQEQAIFTADDAIRNSAGISKLWTATGRAGDGGSYFTLRGFSVQAQLRNGIAGTITNNIDAANLESVQVIKGPSGTLYGSSLISFGGLINRVTKKPFDATSGEVTFSVGSYDLNRVTLDYNTPLDSAKKALFRVNAAYNYGNTFQDNGFNKSFVFDPSFSYKVNDRLTLSFDAEINHGVGTTPVIYYFNTTIADLGVNRADQLNEDYKRSYQANDLTTTSDNANFYAQADYKISDSWKSQTYIGSTYCTSSGYEPYFYLGADNNSLERNVWAIDGNTTSLQIQQNFIGDFKISGLRNRLITGLDFFNQRSNLKYIDPNSGSDSFDVINLKGAIPGYDNFNKAKVDSLFSNLPLSTAYSRYNEYTYSAYASDVLNITDNLLAMLSLRVDHFNTRPISDPASGTTSDNFNQTALSPKFGLVYQVVKGNVSLFGNYMNGFANQQGTNKAGQAFKPEQANQLEGGVKLDLFDGKLSSTISYYDIKVKDIVKNDPDNPGFSVQQGTQYSKGFEAEVIANPLTGFNIIAGYAHNNSLITNSDPTYDNGRRPQTAGPVNSANFWLSYTFTHGGIKGLGAGFGGNYSGDNQVINNAYNGVFTLPAYTVLNTGIFYAHDKYRLSLNVNNLTNKEYWIGYTTVDPQLLRQIIGSIAYRF